MKTHQRKELLEELSAEVRDLLLQAEKMKGAGIDALRRKPNPQSWSAGQNMRHLNVYSEYYIPVIQQCVLSGKNSRNEDFTPGWLGNYFTDLMRVQNNGQLKKKMKSPANAVPAENVDAMKELEAFIEFQHQLLDLLGRMTETDLNQRMPISLSKLIRLKLGDVLLFYVAHEKRHLLQAAKAMSK
jgi:hypothetical protein